MGQTLSHGVYLPNEGERNCYAGLASNWQILNTAVGAIAEKAPLVHTHTKSQITDFPAYGTTAGTICEGNDSRLSDARTPVAHTHGKADITDLFNSANTWTNTQTYSVDSYGDIIKLKNTGLDLSVNGNTGLSNTYQHNIGWVDKNQTSYSMVQSWTNNSENVLVLRSRYRIDANTQRDSSIRNQCTATAKRWYPETDADTDLGITGHRWKTLNGVNPGALSFPDFDNADPIDFSQWDVTGAVGSNYYTPTVNGWLNISIWDRAANSIFVYRSGYERVGVFGNGSMASDGRIALLMPVKANATYTIIIKANANSDIYSANFFPCLGNV